MSIQSVERALSILGLFTSSRTMIGITEMAADLNLTISTVHGLVKTLYQMGFLRQDRDTKKYLLGTRNFELGSYYQGSTKTYQVGAVAAHRLAEDTGFITRLAVRDNDSIVNIQNAYPKSERFQYYYIGPRLALYSTSMGKAILAWLPREELDRYLDGIEMLPFTPHTIIDPIKLREDLIETEKRGYAIDREEMVRKTYCVGAPIFDQQGRPVASISLAATSDFLKDDNFDFLVDELLHTASNISHAMGYKNMSP